jgi:hypothetical protein
MQPFDNLLTIEKELWQAAGDPDRYGAHLAADAIHVFPGWGVAEREAILTGVADADPWEHFELEDVRMVVLDDDATALIYRASAQRAGQSSYQAAITSVYRRHNGAWELVLHQQTPLPVT